MCRKESNDRGGQERNEKKEKQERWRKRKIKRGGSTLRNMTKEDEMDQIEEILLNVSQSPMAHEEQALWEIMV